jgi:hypothetical protein
MVEILVVTLALWRRASFESKKLSNTCLVGLSYRAGMMGRNYATGSWKSGSMPEAAK